MFSESVLEQLLGENRPVHIYIYINTSTSSLTGGHVSLVFREPLRRHGYHQRRHHHAAGRQTQGGQV